MSSSSPSSAAFSVAPTSATPWVIESCVLLTAPVLASLYLVWYYTREIMRTVRPRCALPIIFVAFVTTLSPVGLLVLDISYAQDSDAARSSPVIAAGWTTLFWATQALSWIILPVLQEYCQSGHFSTGRKLWDSVKLNILLYVGMGIVLGALLLYAVFVKGEGISLTNCVGVAIASSNAFGLLLIILFLGYGLAQVPRALWFHSTRANTLRLNRWTAVDMHEGLETRRLEWSDLLRHVSECRDAIVAAASEGGGDALRAGLAAVQSEIDALHGGSGGGLRPSAAAAYIDSEGFSDLGDVTELPGLVRLHQRVKRTRGALEATAFQWETLVDETTRLEEYERLSGEGASAAAAAAAGVGGLAGALSLRYNLRMKRVVLRLLAAAAAAASGMLVFSFGVALPVDRAISPVRLLVMETPPALRHAAVLTLFPYAVLCCYWSLFRFKLFSFHLLVPRHSDPANLCFTATFLCRLIIPLCYSFANVCGLVGEKNGAKLAYTKAVAANMNTVDLLGENFNRYMPCLLLVVFLGTATDLLQRLLNCVGIAVFTFGGQDKLDKDRIDEGAGAIHAEASSAAAAVRRRDAARQPADATRMRRLRGSGGDSDDDEDADVEARL